MKNKVLKSLKKMPIAEQRKLAALVVDLEADGPVQPAWPTTADLEKTNIIVIFHTSGLLVGKMRKTR